MLVFVDESGDTGFKKGATPSLVITLVIFTDHEEADRLNQRVDLLRTELRLSERFEFHFHDNSDKVRCAFLEAVAPYEFFVCSFCIEKARLYSEFLHTKQGLYNYVCGMVFENARQHLDDAIVVIDKRDDRPFRDELARYLRKKIDGKPSTGGVRHIKKVRMERSSSNNLIQLADMICGAIARCHNRPDAKNVDRYRKIIAHRIISERHWPQ